MAGSNPLVKTIVKTYQKIPTAINPLRTRQPTTFLGSLGKAVNPANPLNILQAIPVGKDSRGETVTVGHFAYIDPLDLLNLSGSTPQADKGDPYSNWKHLRYKSREDMKNRVEAQLAQENRYSEPAGPQMTAETYRRARREKVQKPSESPVLSRPGQSTLSSTSQTPEVPVPQVTTTEQQAATLAPARTNPAPFLQEYLHKATQYSAPSDVPLSGFYAAQRQLGSQLGSEEMFKRTEAAGPTLGMPQDAFKQWAEKNPDLAYREMLRREALAQRSVQ